MNLSIPLDEHLKQVAALHSRLCPRQVIGVRMARFACQYFGVDPALERKQIFVYMEIGRCAADGVMVVTYASPMNELMRLVPYGKVAATFVHLGTGAALRVKEHPQSRANAQTLAIDAGSTWEKQLHAYQVMPDDQLLRWQPVNANPPMLSVSEKYSVTCEQCGDRVHEHQEVERDGRVLCKDCAGETYLRYANADTSSSATQGRGSPSHNRILIGG